MQGVASYEAGQTRSKLYQANAQIAGEQAQSEEEAGAQNEERVRMAGAATTGRQVAAIGANNLTQGGTNAQVVAGTAEVNEMDALTTRNNALRRAWGFRVQEASDTFQSDQAASASYMSGAGSILAGGAKALHEYNDTGTWF